jgi:GMP synthase (glutamine-hydrolysing)
VAVEAEHMQIERWLIGHAHEQATHQIDPRTLPSRRGQFGQNLARVARTIFATCLDVTQ